MKTTEELKQQKRYHIERVPGVYFLFNDGEELVYVGQSEDVHRRVGQHRTTKEYSSYTFIEERDPHQREKLESAYIERFKPIYNKQGGNKDNRSNLTKYVNNTKLIISMYKVMKKNGYKKGFVYEQYLEKATYYCKQDLQLICKKLGYKKGWINYAVRSLEQKKKWFDIKKELKKAKRSKVRNKNK